MAKPTIKVLDPKKWLPILKSYVLTREELRAVSADGRRLEKSYKIMKASILEAMGRSKSAECQTYLITREETESNPPTITLASGRIVALTDIKQIILTDNTKITPNDIMKLFSGRDEGDKLNITKK